MDCGSSSVIFLSSSSFPCSCYGSCCDVCVCFWSLTGTWPVSSCHDFLIASEIFFCPSFYYGVAFLLSVISNGSSVWRSSCLFAGVSPPCLQTTGLGLCLKTPAAPLIRSDISELSQSPSSVPLCFCCGFVCASCLLTCAFARLSVIWTVNNASSSWRLYDFHLAAIFRRKSRVTRRHLPPCQQINNSSCIFVVSGRTRKASSIIRFFSGGTKIPGCASPADDWKKTAQRRSGGRTRAFG